MTELALSVVGLTSVVCYVLGTRAMRLPAGGMTRAVGWMLEIVGLGVVFLAVNLTLATAVVLGARAAGLSVSIYLVTGQVWLVLSLLQALLFHAWWRGTGPLDSAAGSGVDKAMRRSR